MGIRFMKLKLIYKIKYRVILGKIAIVVYFISIGIYIYVFVFIFVYNFVVYLLLDIYRWLSFLFIIDDYLWEYNNVFYLENCDMKMWNKVFIIC